MFVAHPAALLICEVAPMPFIVDDAFYDDPDVCSLPDCSVAFLMLAGPWSARNSRSGFVPAAMLARFSSDPDLVVKTLLAARFLERVKGGVRIAEGRGLSVVNAADVAAKAAETEASAGAERSAKSAGGKRGNHERWHEKRGTRAPGCEFCESAAAETADPAKRTSHSDRMRLASDSDATPIDRSRSDLDLSSPVSPKQNRRRPAARGPKPGSQEFRLQVTAKFAAVAGTDIGCDAADAIASDVLGVKKVDHPLLYVLAAIENEADPVGRWLPGHARWTPRKATPRDWCGKCDKYDRRVYDEAGRIAGHCPDCSPKTVPAWEAA
jgi:hypothetical protein